MYRFAMLLVLCFSFSVFAGTTRTVPLDSLYNVASPTKVFGFDLSGQTEATTLTLSVSQSTSQILNIPNLTATDTMATLGLAQTFSGVKTFSSSPKFNVGLNDSSGVSAVSISGRHLDYTNGSSAFDWSNATGTTGGYLDAKTNLISNVADPVSAQDAATRAFVDAQGTLSARVNSTANVTLASPPSTIDGITIISGDLILLSGQTTASENGLYSYNGSVLTLVSGWTNTIGKKVFIKEGTQWGISTWVVSATNTWAYQGWRAFKTPGNITPYTGSTLNIGTAAAPFNVISGVQFAAINGGASVGGISADGTNLFYGSNTRSLSLYANSGNSVSLLSGNVTGSTNSGSVSLATGSTVSGTSGDLNVSTGNSSGGTVGKVSVYGGDKGTSGGAKVVMNGGGSAGGDVEIRPGLGDTSGPNVGTDGILKLWNGATGGNGWIGFKTPASVTNYTMTFPSTSGSANYALTTNGSGVLSWSPISVVYQRDTFSADGSTTIFTLTYSAASVSGALVYVDGLLQSLTDDYTLSGTTLTFTSAPTFGQNITVVYNY